MFLGLGMQTGLRRARGRRKPRVAVAGAGGGGRGEGGRQVVPRGGRCKYEQAVEAEWF